MVSLVESSRVELMETKQNGGCERLGEWGQGEEESWLQGSQTGGSSWVCVPVQWPRTTMGCVQFLSCNMILNVFIINKEDKWRLDTFALEGTTECVHCTKTSLRGL